MALNKQKLALASAATFGVAYTVCAVLVMVAPDFALQLLGWVAHIVNVDKFAGDVAITFSGLVAGLIQVLVYTYLVAWLFAWFYNRFAGQKA